MAQLQYASEATGTAPNRLNQWFERIAWCCGILPMTIGISIVILYWLFRREVFVTAGLLMLPIGAFIVLVGLGFAITWMVRDTAARERRGEIFTRERAFGLIMLLLSNFGIAYLCALVGAWLGRN